MILLPKNLLSKCWKKHLNLRDLSIIMLPSWPKKLAMESSCDKRGGQASWICQSERRAILQEKGQSWLAATMYSHCSLPNDEYVSLYFCEPTSLQYIWLEMIYTLSIRKHIIITKIRIRRNRNTTHHQCQISNSKVSEAEFSPSGLSGFASVFQL